jgi:hypothetical protein
MPCFVTIYFNDVVVEMAGWSSAAPKYEEQEAGKGLKHQGQEEEDEEKEEENRKKRKRTRRTTLTVTK